MLKKNLTHKSSFNLALFAHLPNGDDGWEYDSPNLACLVNYYKKYEKLDKNT